MARATEVIKLIESSNWDLGSEPVAFKDIYLAASAKKSITQLHALYSDIKPAGSKLKPKSQWQNLTSAVTEDIQSHKELEPLLSKKYIDFMAHFGRKQFFIEEIETSSLKADFSSYDFMADFGWVPELSNLIDNESLDASTSPMRVVAHKKSADGVMSFLLQESVEDFFYGSPPEALLSEAGKQLQNNMKLLKRIIITGFHKIIINAAFDLRVILIDSGTLVGKETPSDKAVVAINALKSILSNPSKFEEKKTRVAFFPAVQKIYEDGTVGQVVGGYFHTSSGAKYAPMSKGSGSDLRKDPFQQGGEQASTEPINFIRLEVEFSQEPGKPSLNLNGSSDMFDRPEVSLQSIEVLFSTKNGGSAEFLKTPITYGRWK